MYPYDNQNIFAKILRGEIPNDTVLESTHTLAFNDITPQRPHHILVIPKGAYVCFDDFIHNASDAEIIDFNRAVAKICTQLGVTPDQGAGYRLIANSGTNAHQEVPHFHIHILAGAPCGSLVS